jgi:segregation and condensation protein A
LRLELAADYLVMAAWLAYLKSRLLLPEEPTDGEPTGEEMAARLTFQLQRLEAMRQRGAEIMSRHRLGIDVFARGEPEGVKVIRHSRYELSLFELLRAYAVQSVRHDARHHVVVARPPVFSIEDAIERLRAMLGSFPDWTALESYLPQGVVNPLEMRSAVASTFAASLEVAKQGLVELRQLKTFGPIFIRPLTERND